MKAGGKVRKYAEGGKISDRSALKGQRETSRQRLDALMTNPEGMGMGVDRSPIRVRPRPMFNIDPQYDPITQREREVERRRERARENLNREIGRERERLGNIEDKLEESAKDMPTKKMKKGGVVKKAKGGMIKGKK